MPHLRSMNNQVVHRPKMWHLFGSTSGLPGTVHHCHNPLDTGHNLPGRGSRAQIMEEHWGSAGSSSRNPDWRPLPSSQVLQAAPSCPSESISARLGNQHQNHNHLHTSRIRQDNHRRWSLPRKHWQKPHFYTPANPRRHLPNRTSRGSLDQHYTWSQPPRTYQPRFVQQRCRILQ